MVSDSIFEHMAGGRRSPNTYQPPSSNRYMYKQQVCERLLVKMTLRSPAHPPRWNASARLVTGECLPRAGCRPKSHFYRIFKYWDVLGSAILAR